MDRKQLLLKYLTTLDEDELIRLMAEADCPDIIGAGGPRFKDDRCNIKTSGVEGCAMCWRREIMIWGTGK